MHPMLRKCELVENGSNPTITAAATAAAAAVPAPALPSTTT